MHKSFIILALLFTSFAVSSVFGQKWAFELHGGAPLNVPMPLVIRQEGQPDVRLTAKYYSEPFVSPYYWVWRFSRWNNGRSFEFEAVHHKIYLRNNPEEVQWFGISHGYNMLIFNHAREVGWFIIRGGAGFVLPHPENVVREQRLDEESGIFGLGYYLCGATLNLAVQKKLYLTKRLFATAEVKLNPSWCRVPVVGGNADVYNITLQGIFGIGVDFIKKGGSPSE
ncbi:MAG: hypothetical protein KJ607_03580 [Bacteroidetes bacterium]|nr:hypothetical protein [Bacteroidota bacterium]